MTWPAAEARRKSKVGSLQSVLHSEIDAGFFRPRVRGLDRGLQAA